MRYEINLGLPEACDPVYLDGLMAINLETSCNPVPPTMVVVSWGGGVRKQNTVTFYDRKHLNPEKIEKEKKIGKLPKNSVTFNFARGSMLLE